MQRINRDITSVSVSVEKSHLSSRPFKKVEVPSIEISKQIFFSSVALLAIHQSSSLVEIPLIPFGFWLLKAKAERERELERELES